MPFRSGVFSSAKDLRYKNQQVGGIHMQRSNEIPGVHELISVQRSIGPGLAPQ